MTEKPFAESCERNRDPILAALGPLLSDARQVLEIGSGTGQHAVYFAAALPHLVWQASDHPDHLPGMRLWLDEAGLANTPPPIALQSVPGLGLQPPLAAGRFDAVFTANTLHIMGWPQVEALFGGLDDVLQPGATTVAVYGPFNYRGEYTSASNREFDHMLRARDPASGIRDFEAVDALARAAGFRLVEDAAMPANNRTLVWRRA